MQKRISVENQSILKELYPKLVNGEINDRELAWLKAYFNTGETEEMYALIRAELNLSDEIDVPTLNEREVLARVHGRIASEKFGRSKDVNRPVVKRLWPRISVAAAVATIIVSAGIWFLNKPEKLNHIEQTAKVVDIAPGKVGATLTLANGKQIRLSDAANGEIAKEAGISITKTADGQVVYGVKANENDPNKINTLTTARGETYILTLPDQTKVWLNAASSLTYTAALMEHGVRRVKLAGEAYFQVAKDKYHPFIVESRGQQVEVLGTHFNINSYDDESTVKTTLLEGSVRVKAGLNGYTLKPGQQSLLEGGKMAVEKVDIEEAVAWKNGYFIFNDEDLGSIMRKVSRWYDVEVVYQDETLKAQGFGGRIPRYSRVSELFEMLEMIKLAKFKVEGRRIMVSKY